MASFISSYPLGLKNAVPCFSRVVNEIISKYNCKGTYAYLDDITVCGKTREEHDENLKCFLTAAKKCVILPSTKRSVPTPPILKLGYHISNGVSQPDLTVSSLY